jgi:hypothetical protein
MEAGSNLKMNGKVNTTTTLYISDGKASLAQLTVGAAVWSNTHILVEVDGSQATSITAERITVTTAPSSGSRTFKFTMDEGGVTPINVISNVPVGLPGNVELGDGWTDLVIDCTALGRVAGSYDLITYAGTLTAGALLSTNVVSSSGPLTPAASDPGTPQGLPLDTYYLRMGAGSNDKITFLFNTYRPKGTVVSVK